MTLAGDVEAYLKTVQGVLDVAEMDDKISNDVWDVEKRVRTTLKTEYKNIGFDIAMKKHNRLCVFYDDTYVFGKRSIVKLVADDGTVMGTTLYPNEIQEYKGRDDVIWISDDFVLFPYAVGKGGEAFVLYPFDMPEVKENVPSVKSVMGTSPTAESDTVLKKRFGKPLTGGMYTVVVAFD